MLACLTTKAACAAAALAYALTCCPSAIAWSWPASGAVLRPFTVVPDEYAAGQHRGVDLAGSLGEPVLSPAAGVARFAGTLPLHGRSVTIETADGFTLTLLHLGSVDVARGAIVGEGDRLGTLGSSGEAEHDVPYVHLGIRRTAAPDGYVDPLELLPARPVSAPVPAPAPTPPADAGRAAAPPPVAPTPVQVATPPAGRGRRGRRAFVSGTGPCAGPHPARFARDTRPAAAVGGEGRGGASAGRRAARCDGGAAEPECPVPASAAADAAPGAHAVDGSADSSSPACSGAAPARAGLGAFRCSARCFRTRLEAGGQRRRTRVGRRAHGRCRDACESPCSRWQSRPGRAAGSRLQRCRPPLV